MQGSGNGSNTTNAGHEARSNGEVLVSAALVAGAIGGVAALLNGLRNRENGQSSTKDAVIAQLAPASIDVRSEVTEAAKHLRAAGKQIVESAQTQGPEVLRSAKDDAAARLAELTTLAASESERARKELEKRGVTIDLEGQGEKVKSAVDQVAGHLADARVSGKDLVDGAKRELEKRGLSADVDVSGLMHGDSELGKAWREKLGSQAKKTSKSGKDSALKAKDIKEAATAVLGEVVQKGKDQVEAMPTLSALASDQSFPSLKQLSSDAGSLIAGLTDGGKVQAPELKALVDEHLVPRIHDLRQRAAHLASDVIDSADDGSSKASATGEELGKRFAESLSQAEKALEEWRGSATGKVESAQTHVREAGHQAKEGSKNAGASVLWLGAAGAVIYAGLLRDDQRAWVRQKSKELATGTVELVRDMRGHDGEFTS